MFGKKNAPDDYDKLTKKLFEEFETYQVQDDEFGKTLAYLERVDALKEKKKPSAVSRDTVWVVVGNIVGILAIVAYEQRHVMTSKAFGTIITPRSSKIK